MAKVRPVLPKLKMDTTDKRKEIKDEFEKHKSILSQYYDIYKFNEKNIISEKPYSHGAKKEVFKINFLFLKYVK